MELYRNTIFDAIVICNKKNPLDNLKPPKGFESLRNITIDYVDSTGMALKYYLDATYSNGNSDINVGKKYINLSNQYSVLHSSTLIDTLENNNIEYQILDDGTVRYWYKGYK